MRILSCFLALLLLASALVLPAAANDAAVEVFVTLRGEGLAHSIPADGLNDPEGQAAITAVCGQLDAFADTVRAELGAEVLGQNWYLARALALRLPAAALDALAAMEEVCSVELLTDSLQPADDSDAEPLSAGGSAVEAVYAPDLLGLAGLQAGGMLGEGSIIAVIDTGYDPDHPVFTLPEGTQPTLTRERVEELLPLTSLASGGEVTYGIDRVWHSEKIPFAFDYQSDDPDVSTAHEHGTHVASIAAGGADADGNYVGVAPAAQLLLMKIFDDTGAGGSSEYMLYRAVEDAMILGADVINLSLGAAPGFPYATSTFSLDRHLDEIEALGCTVVCAVGNDGAVGAGSVYDGSHEIDLPLAANPDYGMVADPATLDWTLAVGAYIPDTVLTTALAVGDGSFLNFADSAEGQGFDGMGFTLRLDGQTLPYVVIPGVGAPEDYSGLDVRGKLALVERGVISFNDKLRAAADAGAVGMICYNNADDDVNMAFEEMPIPAVSISRKDGARLIALPEASRTVTVSVAPVQAYTPANAGKPAEFSSVSSGLEIRPTLLSPGYIYAAVPGGTYRTKSGTSMATPAIAGLAALASCADMEENWLADLIAAAEPLLDEAGNPYSVRVQGGGRVRAEVFFTAETALRAADGRGVAELGDGLSAASGFGFTLTLTNRADTRRTYTLSATVGSDDYVLLEEREETAVFAADRMRMFTDASLTVNGTAANARGGDGGYTVSLGAGESRTLEVRIKLSAEEIALYEKYFPNGYYLEGYVFAETEGETLSLPYLGFAGDFDALPYFDTFSYDGGNSFFPQNYLLGKAGESTLFLGCSVYNDALTAEDFRADLIAISPNRDGIFDEAQISLYLLRNLYAFETEVRDAAGETVWTGRKNYYLNKTFADSTGELQTGLGSLWGGQDPDNAAYVLPDGRYTVILRALGFGDVPVEEVSLPITVDTAPPEVLSYKLIRRNGVPTLSVTLQDNHYPMRAKLYRNAVDAYGRETELYCDDHMISYREGRRAITLLYDLSSFEGDYLYLDLYDYALNEKTYRIDLPRAD